MNNRQVLTETGVSASSDEPPPVLITREMEFSFDVEEEVPSRKLSSLSNSPQWNDWRWQMRNRIRRIPQLKGVFPGLDERGFAEAGLKFPMAVTPYYASLIRNLDNSDPIFRMCIPQVDELINPPCLKDDPLEEDKDMGVPGLVHRYPDRALLIATSTCAAYCRHCTRKRVAGHRESCISAQRLKNIVGYLIANPGIHDVIISGGDPFTMATPVLEQILAAVRSVPSVDIIRIGTRVPVVLPMRITDDLVAMIKQFQPVYVNTHFNHPVELTPEAEAACARLVDAGIPMGNQTVLLKGVNDSPHIIEELCRKLLKNRVRPYYMYQCDLVRGVEHFRTPLSRGIEIMEYLRGRMSGLGIPTFVVDAPHGGGKIPLTPNYIVSVSPTHTVIRNCEGMLVSYPEPNTGLISPDEEAADASAPGVWELSSGKYSKIQPVKTERQSRRQARNTCQGNDRMV